MSPDQTAAPPSAPLQFDAADVAGSAGVTCAACGKAIASAYYQVNDAITCPSCRSSLEAQVAGTGSRGGRLMKAALFGVIGGAIGAGIYYAILETTGYEIGFIAILVGYLVGRGVRRGSGGRGGWRYQAIAMAITYFSIGAVYAPLIAREFQKAQVASITADSTLGVDSGAAPVIASAAVAGDSSAPVIDPAARAAIVPTVSAAPDSASVQPLLTQGPAGFLLAVGILVLFVLASPIMVAIANVISLFFVGIAMWEAWRQNRRVTLTVTGPFRVGAEGDAAPAPAGA